MKTYTMKTANAKLTVKVQGVKSKNTTLKLKYATESGIKCTSIVQLQETGLLSDCYFPCETLFFALHDVFESENKRFKHIDEIEKILKSYVKEFWTKSWIKPGINEGYHLSRRTYEYSAYNPSDKRIYRSKFKNWDLSGHVIGRAYSQEIVKTDKNGKKTYRKLADVVIPDMIFMLEGSEEPVLRGFTPRKKSKPRTKVAV